MTEEEMQKLWCPHARMLTNTGTAGFNRAGPPDALKGTMCLGSGCSQWRWEMEWPEPVKGEPVMLASPRPSKTCGYCGLAGKP